MAASPALPNRLAPYPGSTTLAPLMPPHRPPVPYHYLPATPYYPHPTWYSAGPGHHIPSYPAPPTPHNYAFPYPMSRPISRPPPVPTLTHPLPPRPSLKTNRDEVDESPVPASPNPRADKRRKTRKNASVGNPDRADSPSTGSAAGGAAEEGEGEPQQRRASGLAPIKPIGFAAARENRRESGGIAGEAALPSPVVMGFDFQKVDEDQLKTVRDTISIKAQQEALIAQRRRDVVASHPSTPKELTFKGWQPKDPNVLPGSGVPASASGSGSGGVGRRRDKTRDKVERMSINTAGGDKDMNGSKSAPLNQNLSAQQSERGEPPSGSQTSVPSGHHPNGLVDPRNAPVSNVRGSRGDEGDFSRQQAPVSSQYYRRYEPGHSHNRSVTDGGPRSSARIVTSSSRGGYDDRMPPPTAGGRNGYSGSGQHHSGSGHGHPGPSATYTNQDHGGGGGGGGSSPSPSPPPQQRPAPTAAPQMSARREAFLAPYNQLYDLLHQADGLRYNLQELMHRYEGLYANQVSAMQEFKGTAASSNTLLGNLQQSAESLKEMVRYEVGRSIAAGGTAGAAGAGGSGEANKKEVDELKERIKKLEEKLGGTEVEKTA